MIYDVKAVWPWMGNVLDAISTVGHGMWITFRTWIKTYRPERKAFTEHFEYPELPVPVAARYRGFHRFDLTTCISCDQCAKACRSTVFTSARNGLRAARASRSLGTRSTTRSACFARYASSRARSIAFLWGQRTT